VNQFSKRVRKRSADLQSAVSPIFNRQGVQMAGTVERFTRRRI
jgi:hypothetical protein